jgi:hypothetical protein
MGRRPEPRHRHPRQTWGTPQRLRLVARSTGVALLGLIAAVVAGISSTMTSLVALTATTALIMGGTDHPLSVPPDTQPFVNGYVAGADNNYLEPSGLCVGGPCTLVAVVTPEQFFPVFGTMTFDQSVAQGVANLDRCVHGLSCTTNQAVPGTTAPPYSGPFVIYGYSQSATIATIEKRNLAAEQNPPATSFFLLENPNRPNGGILARGPQGLTIPILGVTFSGPTPTDTNFPTVDVSRQYDGISDAPLNPLNLLADLNAGLGYFYLHGSAPALTLSDAQLQDQYGDTTYYLIPTKRLPLLMPLAQLGVPDPILAVLDAPLRVLVEAGYNRTISPGEPTPANFFYVPNPIALAVNLVVAVPTGLDDGLSELGGPRLFGTQPAGPYGVGGPPVTLPWNPPVTSTAAISDPPPVTNNSVLTLRTNAALTAPSGSTLAPTTTDPNLHNGTDTTTTQTTTTQTTTTTTTTTSTTSTSTTSTTSPTSTSTSTTSTTSPTSTPQVTQSTASTSSTPPVTKPERPKIRGPIGSNLPGLKDFVPAFGGPPAKANNTATTNTASGGGESQTGTGSTSESSATSSSGGTK